MRDIFNPLRRGDVVEMLLKNYRLSPDRAEAKEQLIKLRDAVQDDIIPKEEFLNFLRNLKYGKSLVRDEPYQRHITSKIISDYGWRDFSDTGLGRELTFRLSDDFGASLHPRTQLAFEIRLEMDLRNANLENADLTFVNLNEVDLTGSSMSHIRIEGKRIDLEKDAITIQGLSPFKQLDSKQWIPSCPGYEDTNRQVLAKAIFSFKNRNRHKRGIQLKWDGKLIGFMKLKGESSFLAARTVRNKNGDILFHRGMVYAIGNRRFNKGLAHWLSELSEKYRNENKWRSIDVETILEEFGEDSIDINHMRFISDSSIYKLLSQLVEIVDSGKEETIDISPATNEERET